MKNNEFDKCFEDERFCVQNQETYAPKEDYFLVKGIFVMSAIVAISSFLGF